MEHQKRRLFECFAETDGLQFGFARFTQDSLQSIDNYHLLYDDVRIPPDWDLALTGYAYGEILFKLAATEDRRTFFEFDRVASASQSKAVADHVTEFVDTVHVSISGSRQSKAVQAADCLAGAVAEDYKSDSEWLQFLQDENVVSCSASSLVKLEGDLSEL